MLSSWKETEWPVHYSHGTGGNWRSGGLPPEKILQVTPSRTSENALVQNRIFIAFLIDLFGEKENWIPDMFSSNFDDLDRKGTSYNQGWIQWGGAMALPKRQCFQ